MLGVALWLSALMPSGAQLPGLRVPAVLAPTSSMLSCLCCPAPLLWQRCLEPSAQRLVGASLGDTKTRSQDPTCGWAAGVGSCSPWAVFRVCGCGCVFVASFCISPRLRGACVGGVMAASGEGRRPQIPRPFRAPFLWTMLRLIAGGGTLGLGERKTHIGSCWPALGGSGCVRSP